MTTPARKPASRARAIPSTSAPTSGTSADAPASSEVAPRRTSKAASSARSSNGAVPGTSAPASFRTVIIENVSPELDGGRYPVKREVGAAFVVEADLFKEGHDAIAGRVLYRAHGDAT